GDDPVAVGAAFLQTEVADAVSSKGVGLHERPRVEQQLDALARGELPPIVLLVDGLLPAAEERLVPAPVQLLDAFLDRRGPNCLTRERLVLGLRHREESRR